MIGFEVVEVERLEGYYATVAYSLHVAAQELPPEHRTLRRRFRRLAAEMAALELQERRTDIGYSKNYQVVYRKPQ